VTELNKNLILFLNPKFYVLLFLIIENHRSTWVEMLKLTDISLAWVSFPELKQMCQQLVEFAGCGCESFHELVSAVP
jgi:hypothetical protein